MAQKVVPRWVDQINSLIDQYGSPIHVYDRAGIQAGIEHLYDAFSWVPWGFVNYFAVKATPNPILMTKMKELGLGMDCSSMAELVLSERVGMRGEDIMFTSNNTPIEEYHKAHDMGAIINLDDITHIDYIADAGIVPEMLSFRYNPGPRKQGNVIIGDPVEAKFGLTYDQLFEAYAKAKNLGVKRFGLHTMIVSNMLDYEYLVDTAKMLFELAGELHERLGITLDLINLWGGIGVAYRPEDTDCNIVAFGQEVEKLYQEMVVARGLGQPKICMENGRYITGPHGYLISQVRHVVSKYREYVGLHACMANLMRPGMYEAYHHITVVGKEDISQDHTYDMTGYLCENNDKFAVQRLLPEVDRGDVVVIHDAGAHGHSMGFQYNGALRSAEVLVDSERWSHLIRRAETLDDYFATLDV